MLGSFVGISPGNPGENKIPVAISGKSFRIRPGKEISKKKSLKKRKNTTCHAGSTTGHAHTTGYLNKGRFGM